jgi:hypothetical protein
VDVAGKIWVISMRPSTELISVPVSVAREAVVADALEAVEQHVQQEAADKLFGLQYHRLLLGIVAIILVAECDVAGSDAQDSDRAFQSSSESAPAKPTEDRTP